MSHVSANRPQRITAEQLAARYQVALLDAYGVIVDGAGLLPGARSLLRSLESHRRSLLVVTNDASRLPETAAARFQALGLAIPAERIITSGSLVAPYFAAHGLHGARTMVLGTADSVSYVRAAGGEIAPVRPDSDIDALVVCDEEGFSFVAGMEAAISAVARQLMRGREVALIAPNPDVIFPKSEGVYGYTGGAVALLLEAGLARLLPERAPVFARLGKPFAPMYERARELAGTDRLVMVGDQLETDIQGANQAGIDSVLVDTGVSRWRPELSGATPDYLMTLMPERAT